MGTYDSNWDHWDFKPNQWLIFIAAAFFFAFCGGFTVDL
jgi:hypothetical protein